MKSEYPFQNTDLTFAERANDLLSRLTAEEKISQMTHDSPAIERLGIPEYNWWNECLHGVARSGIATVFPQAIGIAATFNAALVFQVATAISDEARAKHHANALKNERGMYKGLTFWTPNINLFRDPRWGRGQETYGECPFLTGRLSVAFVQGLQGNDPRYLKLVATPKHFAVHSGPEKDRHHFNAQVSSKDLRETYLPAFRDSVIEGKAESVMGAYNRTNGEPCCGSKMLLVDILRGEWGFSGYVVSDCGAIQDFHQHHQITSRPEESAALAVCNGCDLNCGQVYPSLLRALEQGLITQEEIDCCLLRLLEVRFRLGMFDPPEKVPFASIPFDVVDSEPHRALALKTAQESIVLLKNEGNLLPLSKLIRSIAVIGPNADNREVLLANYYGLPSTYVTPLEGIRKKVGSTFKVRYQPGCGYAGKGNPAFGQPDMGFAEAVIAAEQSDAVVLCLGLNSLMEGEEGDSPMSDIAGDRIEIGLPQIQKDLLKRLLETGKPIILLVMSGSAVSIPWEHDSVPAIIQQFYPGQEGGTALADVLFGDVNPSGRLPVTVYESLSQLPPFEDYRMENRTYRFFKDEPLYPFGFGLSYTQFRYSNLRFPSESLEIGSPLKVFVDVENRGSRSGDEVVQVYLSHQDAQVRTPLRQLVAFQRVSLKAGEKRTVELAVGERQLALVDEEGTCFVAPGTLSVAVGGSQPDERSRSLGATASVEGTLRVVGKRKNLAP